MVVVSGIMRDVREIRRYLWGYYINRIVEHGEIKLSRDNSDYYSDLNSSQLAKLKSYRHEICRVEAVGLKNANYT